MEAKGHAGIVAGLSSVAVTGYIRHRTRERYDPEMDSPPPISDRLRDRAPLAIAGLGFTGLSTKIATGFDTWELKLLSDSDSNIPATQQMGAHRSFHSLPYVVAVHQTAKLVKYGSVKFGEWLGSKLQISEHAGEITAQLEALADWVLDSYLSGALGHLLGDLPTSGFGGTALRLMAPLTDRNFSLGWIKADSSLNTTFWKGGLAIAGAAWATSGAYLASWKPPETTIREYFAKLRECETFREVLETIEADVERLFKQIINSATNQLYDLPLFNHPDGDGEADITGIWVNQYIDAQQVFGLSDYDRETLVEEGIWSKEAESTVGSALRSADASTKGVTLERDESSGPFDGITLEEVDSASDTTIHTGEAPTGTTLDQLDEEVRSELITGDQSGSDTSLKSADKSPETSLVDDEEPNEDETELREGSEDN